VVAPSTVDIYRSYEVQRVGEASYTGDPAAFRTAQDTADKYVFYIEHSCSAFNQIYFLLLIPVRVEYSLSWMPRQHVETDNRFLFYFLLLIACNGKSTSNGVMMANKNFEAKRLVDPKPSGRRLCPVKQ
jgi:hypothetical protein